MKYLARHADMYLSKPTFQKIVLFKKKKKKKKKKGSKTYALITLVRYERQKQLLKKGCNFK